MNQPQTRFNNHMDMEEKTLIPALIFLLLSLHSQTVTSDRPSGRFLNPLQITFFPNEPCQGSTTG